MRLRIGIAVLPSEETAVIDRRIDLEQLLKFGRYFKQLDLQARFLVARVMTLADRIQGLEESSDSVRIEVDLSRFTEEERMAILRRLEAGLFPEGLEFLARVVRVDDGTDTGQSPDTSVRIRPVDDEEDPTPSSG